MRTIDADALKELFSEVIGHIAKKPEMNGNLEHMIRASAMVIQMIDDAPTVQPERKVSKWIRGKSWSEGAGMGESYGHYWKCNQCNNIVKGDWSQCGDNFCSNCGADMRGEQDG